jgi:hypothetical protein
MGMFRIERAICRFGSYDYEIVYLGNAYVIKKTHCETLNQSALFSDGGFYVEWRPGSFWGFSSFEEAERWFEERVMGVGETMFRSIEL